MHLCNAINELYEQYEAGKVENKGLLPVVKFSGNQTMKDRKGQNFKPNFSIEKWVARPAEFDDTDEVKTASAPQRAAVSEF